MAKFTLYVVRHGQTYFNIFNKLQGWSNSPLTQKGIDGAVETGKRLADIDFKATYCSDMPRACTPAYPPLPSWSSPPRPGSQGQSASL